MEGYISTIATIGNILTIMKNQGGVLPGSQDHEGKRAFYIMLSIICAFVSSFIASLFGSFLSH
jgi:hypothetical protein